MLDSNEDMDPDLGKLEEQLKLKQTPSKDEEDGELSIVELASAKLEEASDLLKRSAVLFSYLSDPNFCKAITKRERDNMDKIVEKIYDLAEDLDNTVSFLEDSEDEEESDV